MSENRMASYGEIERLRQVYRGYQASRPVQERWALDNPGNRAIVRERTEALRTMLDTAGLLPLTGRRILDVGCGSGRELARLTEWGALPADLHGVDLLPERVEAARRQFPGLQFSCGNAEQLAFPDVSFDLVLLFTLFTSILDERMAHAVAGEVGRVLRPGGAVLWYDFRCDNPRNPHVRGVTRKAIQALFPGFRLTMRSVTLLPPLARSLGRVTSMAYPLLVRASPLRTHFLGLLRRPDA